MQRVGHFHWGWGSALYASGNPAQGWKGSRAREDYLLPRGSDFYMEDPQFSRDGKQLLFSRGKVGGDIWIMERSK